MSDTATQGGFVGDPAQAYAPPAAGGCCGGPAPAGTSAAPEASGGCCGTVPAETSGGCCTPAARQDAIDSGAGCCG